jgi:hypothetical protein
LRRTANQSLGLKIAGPGATRDLRRENRICEAVQHSRNPGRFFSETNAAAESQSAPATRKGAV